MAKVVVKMGLDSMTPYAKDKFIAPQFSELIAPNIPDISAERKPLLATFILNSDLSLNASNKNRQLLFNFGRKMEDAFDEYCRARECLQEFIGSTEARVTNYFKALRCFEHCLAHTYQAVCCLNTLAAPFGGPNQFNTDDGSILERISLINNDVKHMDSRFENGEFRDENSFRLLAKKGEQEANKDTETIGVQNLPMWLTNTGLEAWKASVTYSELSKEILELSAEAQKLLQLKPESSK